MTTVFWNSYTEVCLSSQTPGLSPTSRCPSATWTKLTAQALHLISTGSAGPPKRFWSVTKPYNTKFLGHGCWLGPSKPASPYRACSMAILQNQEK